MTKNWIENQLKKKTRKKLETLQDVFTKQIELENGSQKFSPT